MTTVLASYSWYVLLRFETLPSDGDKKLLGLCWPRSALFARSLAGSDETWHNNGALVRHRHNPDDCSDREMDGKDCETASFKDPVMWELRANIKVYIYFFKAVFH